MRGSNCSPVWATGEISPRWASVVMMAVDLRGGALPGYAQKWLSPFAFPALSAAILRRTIAARMRAAGLSTAGVLPPQFARAQNAQPPAWRFAGGDALNISERGHRKHLPP